MASNSGAASQASDDILLSLRPWPREDPASQSLETILPRIHHQYKHFRHVTEERLEQEIKDQEKGTVREDDESSVAESEAEDDKATPETVFARKQKLQNFVGSVHAI
jgi:mediator of RNA polymerase II transcription subunit 17, fungi type